MSKVPQQLHPSRAGLVFFYAPQHLPLTVLEQGFHGQGVVELARDHEQREAGVMKALAMLPGSWLGDLYGGVDI